MATRVTAILPVPAGVRADGILGGLVSVLEQTCDPEVLVVTQGGDPAIVRAFLDLSVSVVHLDVPGASAAALRNAAWVHASRPYVVFVEPDETLAAKDVLARHAAALDADVAVAASYGQTTIERPQGPVVRPSRGRGGRIQRRLVQQKELIASAASVLWRKDALPARPFDEANATPSSLLLALTLSVAGERPFHYMAVPVARSVARKETLGSLEEKARIFLGLLYGARALDERLEQRVRFRLARHLVAIGKHHYRAGDFAKAGSFFGEAVKAAPSYFRGRRYQFLNFVKRVIARV